MPTLDTNNLVAAHLTSSSKERMSRKRGHGLERERGGEVLGTVRVVAKIGDYEIMREIRLGSFK